MKELLLATDFSGLGSPEEALKRLNFPHRVVFACEKDKFARESYLANHKPEIFYDDVTKRNNKTAPYSDIYVFGFPCQAFSLAGKQLGFQDTRGTLFFNSLEYIKEKRPAVFIAENVTGLLSHDKPKGSKSKYGRTFGVIRDSLSATVNGQINLYKYKDCLNYHVYFAVLNSKNFGIPQNRERVFIVGFREPVNFSFPKSFKLNLRLKDLLEEIVDEKYFLSNTAIARLIRKKYSFPKINPEIAGTINTKNNSPQLSFDSGTTLVMPESDNVISIGYINQDTQASKVYSPDGLAPAICAGTHGIAMGYVEVKANTQKGYEVADLYDSINLTNPNSKTRRGRVGKQIVQTLDTACDQAVLIPLFDTEKNAQGARIYDSRGLSVTQSSTGGGLGANTGLYLVGTRIRRLTPREVFRCMGYSDSFFDNCRSIMSDTQLYKQGGNSIVVDTIMEVLRNVLKALQLLDERSVA